LKFGADMRRQLTICCDPLGGEHIDDNGPVLRHAGAQFGRLVGAKQSLPRRDFATDPGGKIAWP
jgi:hypothetical protein